MISRKNKNLTGIEYARIILLLLALIGVSANLHPGTKTVIIDCMPGNVSRGYIQVNQPVTIRAFFNGVETSQYAFHWKASKGDIEGDGNEARYIAPNQAGPVEIDLEITDGKNTLSRSTVSLLVFKQICFLKADDMQFYPLSILSPNWQQFLDYLLAKKVKVSVGLIGDSLEKGNQDYWSRLKALHNTGYVELFNHGYDHVVAQIDEKGQKYWEFLNTPYEHQKEHLLKAQNAAMEKLGITLHTFGAPGNATDGNTVKAIDEIDDLKVWFSGKPSTKLLLDKICDIEYPLGNPNYDEFLKNYNPRKKYYVMQCHPNVWDHEKFDTFKNIFDYLVKQEVIFMTPYEYYKSAIGTFYLLTVESGADTNVPVEASPADINDNAGGNTDFTRCYPEETIVTLTAPAVNEWKEFEKWTIDGIENTARTIEVGMDREHSIKLFYKTPGHSTIFVDKSELYFSGDTSGHDSGPQKLTIRNVGGGPMNWTAATEPYWLHIDPASGTGTGVAEISPELEGLNAGTHRGTITVTDPLADNSPQTVQVILTVYPGGMTTPPFGDFSTPVEGTTVSGSIPVTGWVLDDIGVTGLQIYSDRFYIGDAVFVEGARPDVEASYPHLPKNRPAGWGYMLLTHFLPNGGDGEYTLKAVATDVEGHEVTLGTKTITVDNKNAVKPFGAVDTPTQGGVAAGNSFVNWGWVLTPQPNRIPEDGSTISVYVDGIDLGHPTYNDYRSDIAGLFPGYANSRGALGSFTLDTTGYKNGVHLLHWIATDDAGNADGIGSRYFTIQNLSGSNEQRDIQITNYKLQITNKLQSQNYKLPKEEVPFGDAARRPSGYLLTPSAIDVETQYLASLPLTRNTYTVFTNSFEPLQIKKGYNSDSEPEALFPTENGQYHIEIKELERLVIYLENPENQSNSDEYTIRPYKGFRDEGRGEPCVHPKFSDSHSTLNTQHLTLKNTPSDHYDGYLVNGDEIRPLPIGTTLDEVRGVFYWQPGPGFIGDYRLMFVLTDSTGQRHRKEVLVKIASGGQGALLKNRPLDPRKTFASVSWKVSGLPKAFDKGSKDL